MKTLEQRVVEKQAELITQLRLEAQKIIAEKEAIQRRYEKPARYWLKLQELILSNIMIQCEWDRFTAVLKLNYDLSELPEFRDEHHQ